MPRDFYPRREADIVSWTGALLDGIAKDPEGVGLTPARVERYRAVQARFAELYQRAGSGTTRTPVVIEQKREAARELEAETRLVARLVRAQPELPVARLAGLGLPVRQSGTTVHRPTEAPEVKVESMRGHRMHVQLSESPTGRRARPARVANAAIYVCARGDEPDHRTDWRYVMSTSKTTATVDFPPDLQPGTRVWVTARWVNAKGQEGPGATPAGDWIGFGGMAPVRQLRAA